MTTIRTALGLIALSTICAATSADAVEIQVKNAWIRSALSGQTATDLYMDLQSDTAVKLVGATTPWARHVEIRDDRGGATTSGDAAVDAMSVPANKDVKLAIGGYHLALVGVVQDIGNGEWVPITLDFQDSGHMDHRIDIRAQARGNMFPPGPPPPPLER